MIYVAIKDIDTLVEIVEKLRERNISVVVEQTDRNWIIQLN
jgi:hypothetical protein